MTPYHQRIESGPWFSAGDQLDGDAATERLRNYRRRCGPTPPPYAVYVHVPFCESICSFCALYTHGVGAAAVDVFDEYIDHIRGCLDSHLWAGSSTPPTTVHFGGGTPLSLGLHRFSILVRALTEAFGTASTCEWAIETTTSSADRRTVDTLIALGFRRIHLGIQTLQDDVRARIGRRENGATAISRIESLHASGLSTSVDLILGLEGVGEHEVRNDLSRLYDAGVRMFSICELRHRRPRLRDSEAAAQHYSLWLAVWRFMEERRLLPIHIGQFGRSQADNLYFTHPARQEDCVAIGPYAHGTAGDLYYGNLLLPSYYAAIRAGISTIAMAVDYRRTERVARSLERELIAHRVSDDALRALDRCYPDAFEPILQSWSAKGLLDRDPAGAGYQLTAAGSWFVGNMVDEVRAIAEAGPAR